MFKKKTIKKQQNLPADYHIHTAYCGHAQGKIIDYVRSAIKKGFQEIGFSDHLGRYYLTNSQKRRYWDWGMDTRNIPRYISELHNLSETFSDSITIKTGMEVDYIHGAEHLLKPIADLYPFDHLLASIHCLPTLGWKHLANYTRHNPWPMYDAYFKAAHEAVKSGLFDVLAHIDFIWRYVKWPKEHTKEIFENIDSVVKTATEYNIAIEINVNAYLWSQLYTMDFGDPLDILLSSVTKHHASITIGSDAHKPEFVGKAFAPVVELLKKYNITHYSTFNQRKRIEKKLL